MTEKSDTNSEQSRTNTTRRSVLKAVGAGAALGTGALVSSTDASALSKSGEPAVGYDASTAREALAENAGDLLDELESRGLVEEASAASFAASEVQSPNEYERTVEGVTAIREGDGARIKATTETDTHEIELSVHSERSVSHAFVRSKQDDDLMGFRSLDGDVEPSSDCERTHDCSCGDPCTDDSSKDQQYSQRCCLYPDGSYECSKWEMDGCCTC